LLAEIEFDENRVCDFHTESKAVSAFPSVIEIFLQRLNESDIEVLHAIPLRSNKLYEYYWSPKQTGRVNLMCS
jgi:hypothetical protein